MPRISFLAVFLILLKDPLHSGANEDFRLATELINGRHLNNLVLKSTLSGKDNSQSLVQIPAVVVLYDEKCKDDLGTLGISEENIPPAKFLVFMRYNRKLRQPGCWYERDEAERIEERYRHNTDCPEAFYLPDQGDIRYAVPWFNGIETFSEWIWRKFMLKIIIYNDLDVKIKIVSQGNGPEVSPQELSPGYEIIFKTYVSYTLSVQNLETENWMFAKILDVKNIKQLTIRLTQDNTIQVTDIQSTLQKLQQNLEIQNTEVLQRRLDLGFLFAQNFKQPLIIPKFTQTGYTMELVTPELTDFLRSFYVAKRDELVSFNNDVNIKYEPRINTYDVKIGVMSMPLDVQETLVHMVQPLLEGWSGVALEFTGMDIIELVAGTIIRPHVGDVGKHVISMVIPILKTGEHLIEFEIINFNGQRLILPIQVNKEMIMFERSTIIMGMAQSFKGTSLPLCYINFKPKTHWPWTLENYSIKNGVRSENMFSEEPVFERQLQKQFNSKKLHEEL